MKKTLLLFAFMLTSAGVATAQQAAQDSTQTVGKTRLVAGLVYGSNAGVNKGGIGLTVGGEHFFTEQIAAAPSLTYFMKSKEEVSTGFGKYTSTVRAFTVDLDGRYYFGQKDNMAFYGLAGLAFASTKATIENGDGKTMSEASGSKVGINLGAGLIYPLNERVSFNGQIKYNTPMEQFAIQAGVTFPINL